MKKITEFLLKTTLLSTCTGICLCFFLLLYVIAIDPIFFYESWRWPYSTDIFFIFLIGLFLGLFLGTPPLLIIDKYFPNARWRYILGGALVALIIWTYLTCTGTPKTSFIALAPGPINWPFLIIFMEIGASTGALYTVLLPFLMKILSKTNKP